MSSNARLPVPPGPGPADPGATGPIRTCVGCRRRAPKHELLRTVASDGALVPDLDGRARGRGAHLHPTVSCLDLALRRRAFGRALRVTDRLDPAALVALVQQTDQPTERNGSSSS